MSEEIKMVPNYDPHDPYSVLNPAAAPHVLDGTSNVANVPPYTQMLEEYVPPPSEPAPPEFLSDANALVSGAGKTTTNGIYAYLDQDNWKYSQYYIKRVPYPDPETLSLAIVQGSSVYYYADNVPLPWNATWKLGSFGQDPVPTVTEVIPTRGKKSEKEEEEPDKKHFWSKKWRNKT
jgi:hypothetical protein